MEGKCNENVLGLEGKVLRSRELIYKNPNALKESKRGTIPKENKVLKHRRKRVAKFLWRGTKGAVKGTEKMGIS